MAINLVALEQQLQNKLHQGGIEAAVRTAGPLPPGDLSLLVHVQKVEDGNGWYRDLIGFGLGQSRLFAHVQLDDPRLAAPNQLLSFDVKANSGSTPGLLLSGGPIGAAVKGARIATREMTNDGHRNADYAAGAIARRIEEYYKKRGWIQTANNAKS